MSDKERLEEIKTWLNRGFDLTEEDIEWLIEQAERVQELESELNKQIEIGYKFEGEVYDLAKENKRYREALEFYADRENYEPEHYDPDTHDYISMIDRDKGTTARKALEGEE